MKSCHFPEPFPELNPVSRNREYKKFSNDLLRGEVVYKWMVEGWSTRAIDLGVLNFNDYYPNSEVNGYQSMGILHFLGLRREHQGYFSNMSIADIVATIYVLKDTISGFVRVYGLLLSYIQHTFYTERCKHPVRTVEEQSETEGQDRLRQYWLAGYDESEIDMRLEDGKLESAGDIYIRRKLRYLSNGTLKVSIKDLYDYRCQVCGLVIYKKGWHQGMSRMEQWAYLDADVHHILPLSKNGPDVRSNMICVCPTCHRKFHSGEYELAQKHGELICYDTILDQKKAVNQLHKIVLRIR